MFFSLLFWWENSFLVVCPMCSCRTRGDVDARHLNGAVQPDGVSSSVQDGFQLIQGSKVWEVQLHRNQVFVENQRSYNDRKPKQHTTAEDSSEKWQEQHRPGSCCMFYLLVTDMSRNLWGKKTKQTFFLGTSCEGKKSLLLNNEISISIGVKLTLKVYWLAELPICGETSNAPTRVCVIVTPPVRDALVAWPWVTFLTSALDSASFWSANLKERYFTKGNWNRRVRTERANDLFLPVVMVAYETFVCAPSEAGKAVLCSVFLRWATSVLLTSIITSYSYTLVGAVQKEGDVAASVVFFCLFFLSKKEEIKWENIPWRVDSHLFWVGRNYLAGKS